MEGERQPPIKKGILQTELGSFVKGKESESAEKKLTLEIETQKRPISDALKRETNYTETEFAERWFSEHREEIKAKGWDSDSKIPEYMKNVAWKLGGFDELEKKPKYEEENKKIGEIHFLRRELYRGPLPIKILKRMQDLFERRTPWLEEQLNKATEGRDEYEANVYRNRLKEFSKAVEVIKELTEEK